MRSPEGSIRIQVVHLKEDGINAPFRFRKTNGVHSFALIYAQLANYMPLLTRVRRDTRAAVHPPPIHPVTGVLGSCIRTRSCRPMRVPTH